LPGDVDNRPQQGEAAPLAVDRVLPGRERDVPAGAASTFPDAEADELQPSERSRSLGEMEFSIGQLAGGVAP